MRRTETNPPPPLPGLEPLEPRLLMCAATAITADLATALDAWWRFDEPSVATVADTSASANTHAGTLNGAATVSALGLCGGAGVFAGGEMAVANHTDINLGTNTQRTIALWFLAEDLDAPGRQLLYEEGGGTRGLNLYLEGGRLIIGGWNRAESGWQGTWLVSGELTQGHWHHAVLTLDGGPTTQPDALHAFLDGERFASGEGSQLWSHSGDVTIGGVGDTLFPDGNLGAAAFLGRIDDLRLYNRALTAHDVAVLSGQFNEGAAITLATQRRDALDVNHELPEVVETVLETQPPRPAQPADTPPKPGVDPIKLAASETYTAPGVDQSPDTAPARPDAPPAPPATDAAAAHTDPSSTQTDAEPDTDSDAPQVTEVPTVGKDRHEPTTEHNDEVPKHTRGYREPLQRRKD